MPLCVPGLSNSGTSSFSTSTPQDLSTTCSRPATERSDDPHQESGAIHQKELNRREGRAARKGKSSPILECAQVTSKAGENGQYSGVVGGSSPWTSPSAPKCGDAFKASTLLLDLVWRSR